MNESHDEGLAPTISSNKFSPFTSTVAPGFWQLLYGKILDKEQSDKTKLGQSYEEVPVGGGESTDDNAKTGSSQLSRNVAGKSEETTNEYNFTTFPIWGYYGPPTFFPQQTLFSVDHSSFNKVPTVNSKQYATPGKILVADSVDQFMDVDKNDLIASQIFSLENVDNDPAQLASFIILVYADLKNYIFTYWFGFPTISSVQLSYETLSNKTLLEQIKPELVRAVENGDIAQGFRGFFGIDTKENSLKTLCQIDPVSDNIEYCFADPSGTLEAPGWIVRNYAAYIVKKKKLESGSKLRITSIRPANMIPSVRAYTYTYTVNLLPDWESKQKVLGWEKSNNRFAPQTVDLKSNLDPVALSETSVDFNLKLMKWRLFPELDLENMHKLKVCLMGAGTLGCNVSRTLMGWGVRHISLVDGGRVSHSNPVRQSLFTFRDTGKRKAATAAANLKSIFPGVKAVGHELFIPMPGHPPINLEVTTNHFSKLEALIKESDVIFLLTDTRESRWLPTLLGKVHNKLVINAALGFDSYVVMRHGRENEDLGCYFCTDIVAPGNSTIDRTLDQQCTVSRPGVSFIAGALAVELMMSVLFHTPGEENSSCTLGVPAHSQRGFLSSGQFIAPSFQKFDKCSACSEKVADEFRERGFEFVLEVMNDPKVLETLTGLDQLSYGTDGIVELDDDEGLDEAEVKLANLDP